MARTPTYAAAKARVEAGDFSFEAVAAMTIAHGRELVAASDALDRRDPFAPPTICPLCWGDRSFRQKGRSCRVCKGSGEFIRSGIFVAHACSRCRDGALPERCPTKVPGNCGNPVARND